MAKLDRRSDTVLKLIMTLKSLKAKKEGGSSSSTTVKLIESLLPTLTSLVHDMTEDAKLVPRSNAGILSESSDMSSVNSSRTSNLLSSDGRCTAERKNHHESK